MSSSIAQQFAAVALMVLLAGCTWNPESGELGEDHTILVRPMQPTGSFYGEGLQIQISGHINAEPSQRVEFGIHSFTATVIEGTGPWPAKPADSQFPNRFTLPTSNAILAGPAGTHIAWVWYGVYGSHPEIPIRSGWHVFHISGDATDALLVQGEPADSNHQGATDDRPGPAAIDAHARDSFRHYEATVTNTGPRATHAWVFGSFIDFRSDNWERRPLEPAGERRITLAPNQTITQTFDRPAWASSSNFAHDTIIVRYHPMMRQLDDRAEFALSRPSADAPIQQLQ